MVNSPSSLVISVRRDGHHLVGAIFGGTSARARDDKMIQYLDAALLRLKIVIGLPIKGGPRDGRQSVKRDNAVSTKSLLFIRNSVVFECIGHAFEYRRGVNEIQAVRTNIRSAFTFRPAELHIRPVYTQSQPVTLVPATLWVADSRTNGQMRPPSCRLPAHTHSRLPCNPRVLYYCIYVQYY